MMRICPRVNKGRDGGTAQITTRSSFDNRMKFKVVALPEGISLDQLQSDINAWFEGKLIQDVLPYLSYPDREFVMTGTLPDEWEAMFPAEED